LKIRAPGCTKARDLADATRATAGPRQLRLAEIAQKSITSTTTR
jgi:hypothetical protein